MKIVTFSLLLLGLTINPCQALPQKKTYPLIYSQKEKNEKLRDAYECKDLDAIKSWVSLGADINAEMYAANVTPLISAISDKNIDMVKFLLSIKGIIIDFDTLMVAVDGDSWTVHKNSVEIIALLCDHDIDSTAHGYLFSPLSYAYHVLCNGEISNFFSGLMGGCMGQASWESVEHPKQMIRLFLKKQIKDIQSMQERLQRLEHTIDDMVALYRKNLTKTFHEILAEDIYPQLAPLEVPRAIASGVKC